MMREDPLIQAMREAIRKRAAKPDQEQLDDLIRRGIIDEKGRMLVHFPEPPKKTKKKKKRS
jgi:hypothetical protein